MDANSSTSTMDGSIAECPPQKYLSVPILYMMIASVGVIGNIAVPYQIIFYKRYKKTIINIYIIQMAIADFIFCIQIYLQAGSMLRGRWTYGIVWCRISEAIKMLNYYSSIAFLTVMSIDRYMAINLAMSQKARKFRTKSAAYIVVVCTWCIPFLSVINIFIYADVQECDCSIYFPNNRESDIYSGFSSADTDSSGLESYYDANFALEDVLNDIELEDFEEQTCSYVGDHVSQYFKTWIVCNFLLAFVLPLVVICVSYALVLQRIMKPTPAVTGCKSQTSIDTRKRVTRMVIGLITLFVICWLPYHSFHLARLNGLKLKAGPCFTINTITILLAYCNSAFNPLLYIYLSTNCPKKLLQTIGKAKRGRQQRKTFMGQNFPITSNRETKIFSLSAKSRNVISMNSLEIENAIDMSMTQEIQEDKM